jgi:N utilization substance protein A
MVVQELRGERIDIVEYSDDKRRFVANALKPAEIESVELSEDGSRALLMVKDEELSLAIGKGGLNAMLASRLTKVEIDILSESQLAEREAQAHKELLALPSVGDSEAEVLMTLGLISANDIVQYGVAELARLDGMTMEKAEQIYREAREYLGRDAEEGEQAGEDMKDVEPQNQSEEKETDELPVSQG